MEKQQKGSKIGFLEMAAAASSLADATAAVLNGRLFSPSRTLNRLMGLTDPIEIRKQSRGEKKARRLLMKLGLKRVENVDRVTLRTKNSILHITQPDVYEIGGTYICFGQVRVEELTNDATQAQEEKQPVAKPGLTIEPLPNDKEGPELDEARAGKLDDKDIELV